MQPGAKKLQLQEKDIQIGVLFRPAHVSAFFSIFSSLYIPGVKELLAYKRLKVPGFKNDVEIEIVNRIGKI